MTPWPDDSIPRRMVKVLNLEKENKRIASTGENLGRQCDKWKIDKSLIEKIFRASHPISSSEFHFLYDVWPCNFKGKMLLEKDTFSFEINPGSYIVLWNKDTSIYYGYKGKKYKKYFLSEPWDPEKGE